jgi:hypothetical protein
MKANFTILLFLLLLVSARFYGQGIIVQPGAYVTVQNTASIKTTGSAGLVLKSAAAGTGSLADFNSTGGVAFLGTGTATVERYINGAAWDWHLLSSPVAAQAISGEFTPSTSGYDFYTWYEPQLTWVNFKNTTTAPTWNTANNGTTNFIPGTGYLVAYQAANPTKIFQGTLNSGTVNFSLTYGGQSTYKYFNLVGNPYPCAIDWKAVSGWNRINLVENGTGKYDYWIWNNTVGNYGVFNSGGSDGSGTNSVGRYIAMGQGFYVLARQSGNFSIGNEVKASSSQPWLKSGEAESGLLRLKMTSSANTYSDEMFIEFDPASEDGGSTKFWSFYAEAPEIYSVKEGNNYSINRYNAFSDDLLITVAAKTGVSATYTLQASNIADFNLSNDVWLIDQKTGIITNLKQTPSYSFTGTPSDDRNRFQLVFRSITDVQELSRANFTVTAADKSILVRSSRSGESCTIQVFNILGQLVSSIRMNGNDEVKIPLAQQGIYVVSVISKGSSFSSKVVLR